MVCTLNSTTNTHFICHAGWVNVVKQMVCPGRRGMVDVFGQRVRTRYKLQTKCQVKVPRASTHLGGWASRLPTCSSFLLSSFPSKYNTHRASRAMNLSNGGVAAWIAGSTLLATFHVTNVSRIVQFDICQPTDTIRLRSSQHCSSTNERQAAGYNFVIVS